MLFLTGGALYVATELIYRKKSHYSMFAAGGLCALLINLCCNLYKPLQKANIMIKALIGGAVITSVELLTGAIVNLKLGLSVWDYSDIPYNFKGQICPRFSTVWILLSFPAIMAGKFFNGKK